MSEGKVKTQFLYDPFQIEVDFGVVPQYFRRTISCRRSKSISLPAFVYIQYFSQICDEEY